VEPRFFGRPSDFRRWLEKSHERAEELWVGFYKKGTGRASITWDESVDEALCFGWIDGIRKSVDERSYMIRFTPRKPKSIWSDKNVRRMEELIAEGRVAPAGLAAFERKEDSRAGRYSFEQGGVTLGAEYEARLRANAKAWADFTARPPSYRKTVTWWILSAKREETRLRRLDVLIEHSAKGEKIPPMRVSRDERG
jgi:uncharacterized protein YdeI (YjbR/CyaY-like superfamily)